MRAHSRHPMPIDTCFACMLTICPSRPVGVQVARGEYVVIVCRRCVSNICDRAQLQQLLDGIIDMGYIIGHQAAHREISKRRNRARRNYNSKARGRRTTMKVLTSPPPAPDDDKSPV